MKPKLIMLNGPLGIGKSTLAKRYAADCPELFSSDQLSYKPDLLVHSYGEAAVLLGLQP